MVVLLLLQLATVCRLMGQSYGFPLPEGTLPSLNAIQYGDSAIIQQWNARRKEAELQDLPMQILHIGDSHVQSGALTAATRKQLQQVLGSGGVGLMFPYAGAKTYTPRGYKTRVVGKFEFAKSFTLPPKLPMGLLGATIKTQDPNARFRFLDLPTQPLSSKYVVEVWADGSDSMYTLQVFDGLVWKDMDVVKTSPFYSNSEMVDSSKVLSDTGTDGVQLISKELPISTIFFEDWKVFRTTVTASDSVVIRCKKTRSIQSQIELYGVNIYNCGPGVSDSGTTLYQPAGMLYHAAGMGGARFESLLYESLLPQQLQYLNPSLVLLDFGTNDVAPLSVFPDKLREQIELSIDIIQHALPNALIVLVTPMDMEFRGKKVVHTYPLAVMMKEIAQSKGCLLWDFFWLAGAKGSLPRWQAAKKVSSDGIHMTEPGYWLKGNLLSSALLEFFSAVNTGNLAPSRWLNEDSVWLVWNGILKSKGSSGVIVPKVAAKRVPKIQPPSTDSNPSTATIPASPKITPLTKSKPTPKITPSPFLNPKVAVTTPKAGQVVPRESVNKPRVVEKKMRHTVKPGEDIFDIAFEFGVTVAQIKKWNGLTSNSLRPGKVIVIVKSAPVGPRR